MKHIGFFEKAEEGFRLVEATAGDIEDNSNVILYWLVSEKNGEIKDAKFQAFGEAELLESAEKACTSVIGKNYDQATRINSDNENVTNAIKVAAVQCRDIPLDETYVGNFLSKFPSKDHEYNHDWESLKFPQKMAVIEEVLDREIRPFVQMDGGNVEVVNLIDNEKKLVIAYRGACANCFSALGSTLSYIQQIISTKVHPEIIVEPELTDYFSGMESFR